MSRFRGRPSGTVRPVPFDTPTAAGRNNSFPQHGLLKPEIPLHSTWTSEPGYNFSHGAPSHMDWEFNDIRTEVSHDVRYVCPCALSICGSLCFSSASNRIYVLPPAQPPSSSSRPGPSPMYLHLDSQPVPNAYNFTPPVLSFQFQRRSENPIRYTSPALHKVAFLVEPEYH
jgi:hypothetical protein